MVVVKTTKLCTVSVYDLTTMDWSNWSSSIEESFCNCNNTDANKAWSDFQKSLSEATTHYCAKKMVYEHRGGHGTILFFGNLTAACIFFGVVRWQPCIYLLASDMKIKIKCNHFPRPYRGGQAPPAQIGKLVCCAGYIRRRNYRNFCAS